MNDQTLLPPDPAASDATHALFQGAVRQHKSGRLTDAEDLYRQVLALDRGHADSLHLLGVLASQTGRYDQATTLIGQAIAIAPDRALYHAHLGNALQELGRWDEALTSQRRAVSLDPRLAAARISLGQTLRRLNRLEEAAAWYQTALGFEPDNADAQSGLGSVWFEQGRLDEAEGYFRKAIAGQPDQPDHHRNLAAVLVRQDRREAAAASCRQAAALDPRDEATLLNLAALLRDMEQWDEAAFCYRKALDINPDNLATHYALSVIHMQQEQPDKAAQHLRAILRLHPDDPVAHTNLGVMALQMRQPETSIAHCRAAIRLQPDLAQPRNNLAISLLWTGDLAAGFEAYEWRWQVEPGLAARRDFPQPQWTGQRAQGCTLLVHAEQGFGDTLQFCRYVPLAQARGLRVVMEVPASLTRLMRSLRGVGTVVSCGEPLPRFDLHCPTLSLPRALGTTIATIPGTTPYLFADPAATADWRIRLGPATGHGPRVGLVWAGGFRPGLPMAVQTNRRRSMAPQSMAPLLRVPGLQFFSLQKNEPYAPADWQLIDHTGELRDFADTAALVANLDLVISVDTAVVHLAGALGKPVWLLDRFDNCWRWLDGRRDSPWYPTLRIYRQPRPGDWDSVIEEVVRDLHRLADASPDRLPVLPSRPAAHPAALP